MYTGLSIQKLCIYSCLEANAFSDSIYYSKDLVSLSPTSSLCCFGFVDYNQEQLIPPYQI